jgi:hypothetical protein
MNSRDYASAKSILCNHYAVKKLPNHYEVKKLASTQNNKRFLHATKTARKTEEKI